MMTSSLSRQSRLDVVVGLLALATLHCLVARTEAYCTQSEIARCMEPVTFYETGNVSRERMDKTCRELDTVIPCLTNTGCPMDYSTRGIYQGLIDGFTYLCGQEQKEIFLAGQYCFAFSSLKSALYQCNKTLMATVTRDSYCWASTQFLKCMRIGLSASCSANFTSVYTIFNIKSVKGMAALMNCVIDESVVNTAAQNTGSLLLLAATLFGAAAFLNKR